MIIEVLALDLEATLVDNAMSAAPRTGLVEFLDFCNDRFSRVAIYTTVEESDAREVVRELVRSGHWPVELANRLEFVDWSGEYKDLRFIAGAVEEAIVLVDDDTGWIRPDQKDQWIPIEPWDGNPDSELARVRERLVDLLEGQ